MSGYSVQIDRKRFPEPTVNVCGRPLRWLSSWLSFGRLEATFGADGWESHHPGRVIGAPQTVLKTAGLPSTHVRQGPLSSVARGSDSSSVRLCLPRVMELAVVLAAFDFVLRCSGSAHGNCVTVSNPVHLVSSRDPPFPSVSSHTQFRRPSCPSGSFCVRLVPRMRDTVPSDRPLVLALAEAPGRWWYADPPPQSPRDLSITAPFESVCGPARARIRRRNRRPHPPTCLR